MIDLSKIAYQIDSNGVFGCTNLHVKETTVRISVGGRKVWTVTCTECGRVSTHLEYANVAKKRKARW